MSPTNLSVLVPELVDAAYTGTVVASREGYCFVGDVKQGYATVATNGDVFCPIPLPLGALVEFDMLDHDNERTNERSGMKFRTDTARVLATPEGLVTTDRTPPQIARAEKILALSSMRTAYHSRAKVIAPEAAQKAADNGPFAAMACMANAATQPGFDIVSAVGDFLRNQFATLDEMGFACTIANDVDETAEQGQVDAAKTAYVAEDLGGQAESLQNEYNEFRGIRNVFRMLHTNNVLNVETVVPIRYLPDLLVAAPVWYTWFPDIEDQTGKDDPLPDASTKFFCDRVGTREFAWLFQIYNRRSRPLSSFAGREIGGKYVSDTMPPRIVKMIGEAKKVFDFVVIATPYHDIASREWADPNWMRSIDPFLFGFFKRLDFMFMLGRWSGTGLFPNMCEMVADTMSHLALNKKQLERFPSNTYWHRGGASGTGDCLDARLEPFADEVLASFEEGRLFPFLRGETKA